MILWSLYGNGYMAKVMECAGFSDLWRSAMYFVFLASDIVPLNGQTPLDT